MKNIIKFSIIYNIFILAIQLLTEISSHDPTGEGMVLLPLLLAIATIIHIVIIFTYNLRAKKNWRTHLSSIGGIIVTNLVALFADILIVIVILNILGNLFNLK